MSSLSTLLRHDDLISTLYQELLYALVAVKSRFYRLTDHERISEETLREVRQSLAAFVNGLLVELAPQKAHHDEPIREFWPSIIGLLKRKHKGSLESYGEQLQVTLDNLLTSRQALTKEDLQRLDEISYAIGDDLAALRRQIVRR